MHTEEFTVPVVSPIDGRTCFIRGDEMTGPDGAGARLLFCHGAGESCRKRFAALRLLLAHLGAGSTAFDFTGHGESQGGISESSLEFRTLQAAAVIKNRLPSQPLNIIGSSMGAYAALRLSSDHEVKTLVLLVPGIYSARAYRVPFGPAFSDIIRTRRSWADTDAFELVARFDGSLVVAAGELDSVVPLEIPETLVKKAVSARKVNFLKYPAVGHSLLPSLETSGLLPELARHIVTALVE